MSDDFQHDPFAEEGEARRDPRGVTHVVAFCGASLGDSRQALEDDIDRMTCVAAGVLR